MRQAHQAVALVLDSPQFFQDEQFLAWLASGHGQCTNYRGGAPDECTELLVLVDPGLQGEGSAADMPVHCWEAIIAVCRDSLGSQSGAHHVRVHLRNTA